MKPCASQRKKIALAAAGVLPPEVVEKVQAHVRMCAGCRAYAAEIEIVCREQASAADCLITPDEAAWDRSLHRLRREQQLGRHRPMFDPPWPWLRLTRWALAGAACLVLGVILISRLHEQPPAPQVAVAPKTNESTTNLHPRTPEPSLMAYRLALNHSMDDLDNLLARHEPLFLHGGESLEVQSWLLNPD